jgi:hypothetical protein
VTAPLAHPFTVVNDAHSSLNPTLIAGVVHIRSVADIRRAVNAAAASGSAVSICWTRPHSTACSHSTRHAG